MRTTPPRPFDMEKSFPVLADWRRTATRLHPRPGDPGVRDSSIGGPLLWPADEPWPVCTAGDHYDDPSSTVGHVLRQRLVDATRSLARARGEDTAALDEQWQTMMDDGKRIGQDLDPAGPFRYIPVAQLYARDVPGLPVPPGADLMQLLWCPFMHEHCDYLPSVRLVWRDAAAITTTANGWNPDAPVEDEDFVPQPCMIHPEQVTEYAPTAFTGLELPDDDVDYIHSHLLAAGWKVGGWGDYCGVNEPEVPDCECGVATEAFFTVGNGEWSTDFGSWRPVEDEPFTPTPTHPTGWDPVRTSVGRGYVMQLFKCTNGFDCPVTTRMT